MLLYKPLCRPDGAVFLCCVFVSGCVAPLGLVIHFARRHLDTFYIRTLPHSIRHPADTLAFHVDTSERRHVDTFCIPSQVLGAPPHLTYPPVPEYSIMITFNLP